MMPTILFIDNLISIPTRVIGFLEFLKIRIFHALPVIAILAL
jgi:hypothetical protein